MMKIIKFTKNIFKPTLIEHLDNDAIIVLKSLEDKTIALSSEQLLIKEYFNYINSKRKKQ